MATTRKTKNGSRHTGKETTPFEMVDWFLANRGAKFLSLQKLVAVHPSPFRHYVWPAGQEYFSPLNPIFLAEVGHLELLNNQPVWLARDGLVPLLWFFRLNPRPGRFTSRILVYEDFVGHIPEAWRPFIGTYRYRSQGQSNKVPSKLLVTAKLSPVHCSLEMIEKSLAQIKAHYGEEQLSKMEKKCLLIESPQIQGLERKDEYICEFLFRVNRILGQGQPLVPISVAAFESTTCFETYDIVEIDEKMLIADNYVIQSLLQKGANFVELGTEARSDDTLENLEKGESFIRLSPYHGYVIRNQMTAAYMELGSRDNEAVLRSDANLKLPWPEWIIAWRSALSQKNRKRANQIEI